MKINDETKAAFDELKKARKIYHDAREKHFHKDECNVYDAIILSAASDNYFAACEKFLDVMEE